MLLERIFHRLRHLITVLDALTIGLFGAIGTTKALALGLPEIPAIFVGVISAVGGSILRDVLLNVPIALMSVGSLYAVAALFGTTSLVLLVAFGADITLAAIVCVALTFLVRVLAVLFKWTLPGAGRPASAQGAQDRTGHRADSAPLTTPPVHVGVRASMVHRPRSTRTCTLASNVLRPTRARGRSSRCGSPC